jgi:integrase
MLVRKGLAMAARGRKPGKRLLVLKHNLWWFRRAIPAACQKALGRGAWWMESLATSDFMAAQKRRDVLERETDETFSAIRAGTWSGPKAMDAEEMGRIYRAEILAAEESDPGEPGGGPLDTVLWAAEAAQEALRGDDEREAFQAGLQGKEPVGAHLEAYLRAVDFAPKTVGERRGNIGRFAKWAAAQRPAMTLDLIDRRKAGRYVAEVIDPMHPSTQKKHLAALRGYWSWLAARGHVTLPPAVLMGTGWPWDGQQAPKTGKRAERGARDTERPFTSAEVKLLLDPAALPDFNADHGAMIREVLRISLLSGMRLAEVLTLWAGDVRQGTEGAGLVFDIQEGKTEAAARAVPVHPALMDLVQGRLKDAKGNPKGAEVWLFHEMQNERDAGDTFGKRFKRYREALGVDDKREDKRRSLVNFHSARRWFATAADRAGQPEGVIKDTMGHVPDKGNVTRRSYIRRSSEAQMRACVEAVKLPDGVE